MKIIVFSTILCLIFTSCSRSDPTAQLYEFFQEAWEKNLKENPEFATYLGDDRYNDRLVEKSLHAIDQRQQQAVKNLERLRSINRSKLSAEDQLNYELFEKTLTQRIEGHPFKGYLMPVNQMDGVQIDFPNLVRITPFRIEKDYENYFARLSSFPALIDQTIALMTSGIFEGITQPVIVLRSVPAQIKAQFGLDVKKSPFFQPYLSFPDEMAASVQENITEKGKSVIERTIFPAYKKLYDFFVEEYLPAARGEISAALLPNGEAYYRFLVKRYTTTDLSPEEIHNIGLREVERIRKEMDKTISISGFEGTFDEFVEYLRTNPQFYYTSEEALLDGYRVICKKADPELARLFGRLPKTPYGVIPIPDYQAPASPTAYYHGPSADGSRPGNFWANTYRLDTRPKYEMEALALHEAVPGHHLQIALAKELEGLPEFRKHGGFTAFVEGWALYAESLGEEMGFYDDPYSKFGQLTYEMWRACRLVVDTGMHALGWSRQEAIDFLKKNTAKTENDIVVEIDRYIAWPGQALAYKIGELKIKELRQQAKEALGEDFDIRKFHDVVLGKGALPLDFLEKEVKSYLSRKDS